MTALPPGDVAADAQRGKESPGRAGASKLGRYLRIKVRRSDGIPKHKSGKARIAQASLLLPLYLFITLSPTSCYAGCPLQYSRLGQLAQASLCRQMAHSRCRP